MFSDTIRILLPAGITFLIGMGMTPILAHYLYKYKAWKKTPGKMSMDGTVAQEFNRLHAENEMRAPRMGGIVVWGSVVIATIGLAAIAALIPNALTTSLDFLSRNQTWIPLATLAVGGLTGLIDDILTIRPNGIGVPLGLRLLLVIILSGLIGLWFFVKLDVSTINIPFMLPLEVGWLIVPFFVALSLGVYASGVIDGIDGLSGSVFISVFSAYAIIAFAQNQIDLAAFIAAIVGGLLAFLWFNVPPARFYMSDTGTMALTLALAVVVFMTDSLGGGYGVALFPIIGAILVATVLSNVIQVLGKRWWGVKIFRVAPLHHHFEAIGWPGYKVTMRYWILSIVCAVLGVIVALTAL